MNKRFWWLGSLVFLCIAIAICIGVFRSQRNTGGNPFSAALIASAPFDLYYPTSLPHGYTIDRKSIEKPAPGVIVLTIKGPNKAEIYISQQARPKTFDFGGYYKGFADLQESQNELGTVAIGRIDNGHTVIGSLATNHTWILSNTQANVSLNEFKAMFSSLTSSP